MTSIEFHTARRASHRGPGNAAVHAILAVASRAAKAFATWRRRRRDRAAFMQLLGKDDWVYRDMGITRADAEWAAGLPKQINAAKELESLRARNMLGR